MSGRRDLDIEKEENVKKNNVTIYTINSPEMSQDHEISSPMYAEAEFAHVCHTKLKFDPVTEISENNITKK